MTEAVSHSITPTLRSPTPPPTQRSVKRTLGSIVLGFELIVVFLGALVVFGLKTLPPLVALGGGVLLCMSIMATIALLRFWWGFWVGWLIQLSICASGFFNSALFIVGGLFTAIWAYSLFKGAQIDYHKRSE